MWNCINCRRRKVRCDRRYPCAPCTKNKAECVFPVSGRIPRRSRDVQYPSTGVQKQAELVGRLRRLEAMVSDLGSQVEHVAAVDQGSQPVENSTSVTIAAGVTSSETARADHQLGAHSESAKGNSRTTHEELETSPGMEYGIGYPSQKLEDIGDLVVANDGDLLVRDRFWTVFCKEVCSSTTCFCFAL